jgi:ABC-type cobalamin/Fe3+-siderophores transport system ATPase subunit
VSSARADPIPTSQPDPGTALQANRDRPAAWVAGLAKSYGFTVVPADVDMQVAAGETVALLDPNGGGQTTAIGLLLVASTAVGVVRPERAGMASGINSTFRQVGIATGIVVLGTLFPHKVTEQAWSTMTTVPGMSGRVGQVAGAVQSGQAGRLIAYLPARTGQAVAMVTRSAFTAGLNELLLVAAIRGQDFVAQGPGPPGG